MNDLLELTGRIRETSAAIARHERALAEHHTPSLEASLHSLQKRMKKLAAELAALDPGSTAFRSAVENGAAAHHGSTAKPTN